MNSSLGAAISHLRKKSGLSQKDLCCEILSRSILSRIENNKITPSIYQLKHLANKLGVTMDELINYKTIDVLSLGSELYSEDTVYDLYNNEKFHQITSSYEKGLIKTDSSLNTIFYVAFAYLHTEFYKESETLFKKFNNLYLKMKQHEQIEYINNFANSLNCLCKIKIRNSNYKKAIEYELIAKENLELHNKTNSRVYYNIISNLGSLYCTINNYEKVIKILPDFLASESDLAYLKLLPNIHLSLNIAYYNIGEYEKSIYHIIIARVLYNYTGRVDIAKSCYLNHINALRYSNRFEEAFNVLHEFSRTYPEDMENNYDFLLQKVILYFNIEDYPNTLKALNDIKVKNLDSVSKATILFIKGHINFINKEFDTSASDLKKCICCFEDKQFYYDLKLIYMHLCEMTPNSIYKEKLENLSTKNSRKNVLCMEPI